MLVTRIRLRFSPQIIEIGEVSHIRPSWKWLWQRPTAQGTAHPTTGSNHARADPGVGGLYQIARAEGRSSLRLNHCCTRLVTAHAMERSKTMAVPVTERDEN